MKVALINSFPPEWGPGVYSFSLFNAIKQYGTIDAKMICTYPSHFTNLSGTNNGITFLSSIHWSPFNHLLNFFINPLRLSREYDLYHFTTQSLGQFVKFNHPCIITIHDIYVINFANRNTFVGFIFDYFRKKSMIYAKSADAIICPSEFTKNELIRTIGVNAQKINVIPNGVDHNLFKPRDKIVTRKRLGLPLDKRIVLHVGSELPRKNIDTLIKAFQILSTRMPKKVLLVRVGQQTNKMKKLIKSYNLEEFILHFNVRPRNELPYFFNAADVAVYPSTYEGFGIPPLEAMASGCPIITGNRTSLPEVVGDAGILVDPLDDKLMAEKIEMVLENHKLREDLIMKGIKRAATYTWEKCAEAHINFYRRVAMLSG